MSKKSVKRADVEDVFDVGDLGGRTRESGKAQLACDASGRVRRFATYLASCGPLFALIVRLR